MLRLLLLCGGKSKEKDISLNSARSVYDHMKGLSEIKATVVFIDVDMQKYFIDEQYLYSNTSEDFRFLLKSEVKALTDKEYCELLSKIDMVFPIIHGVGGEDGVLQNFFETEKIPFIGSPSSACKLMYNKHHAEDLILKPRKMVDIPKIFVKSDMYDYETVITEFITEHKSICLKPTESGSSFGVKFANSIDEALTESKSLLNEYNEIVIEKKCKGKEFTVIILENNDIPVALIPTEIEIKENEMFSNRLKYLSTNMVRYYSPPRFDNSIIEKICVEAENLFTFVGARDFLRIDGWVLDNEDIYFSDFNPISGMEQNSFIFQQATNIGFTHVTLLEYIIQNACKRYNFSCNLNQVSDINKRRVNVLLGGITSERQVSLLSGTNVWMKLLHSKKYSPVPYILTNDREDGSGEWKVSEIPYSFALLHTTEEIIDQLNNYVPNPKIINNIRSRLGFNYIEVNFHKHWSVLYEFISESKKQGAFIFNGLHGGFGENGEIQTIFKEIGIDYQGCGAYSSALCMDKYKTGEKVTALGIASLRSCKKILGDFSTTWEQLSAELNEPIIAKPNGDGCSTGVVVLYSQNDLDEYLNYCKTGEKIPKNTFKNQKNVIEMPKKYTKILFEEYIKTDAIEISNEKIQYTFENGWIEITVGVLEKCGIYHSFIPSITISKGDILSLEEKFQEGNGVNLTPPPENLMSISLQNRIKYYAERIAENCYIKDYCRIDMFANNKTGEVIVIEINTLPGLSPSTVLFQQAAKESLYPLALLERIMESEGGSNMVKLTFKEIVQCTSGTTSYIGEDFPLSNVKFDSRDNMKGTAFIAFVTEKDNGHRYIQIAANKGAKAVIVSEDVNTLLPTIKVNNTKKAYQDIAAYCRDKFTKPVIALTGSNGKTTVKDMLTSILSAQYKVLSTEKNLNNELGVSQTLLKLDNSYDIAVVELGMNHKGEIKNLTNITKPTMAIITKIGTAHMGNLGGTREDVFHTKMEIIEGIKSNGTLVLCSDDDLLSMVKSDELQIVFCGLNNEENNFIYADNILQFWNETGYGLNFSIHYNENSYDCSLPVLGRHNVQNALLALTVGIKLGVPIEKAIEAIQIYPRSSMRLETATIHGIKFIKDYYNASPDSTKAAIDTISELKTEGSRIAILGDLLELGDESAKIHENLANYTIGKIDKVFFVGDFSSAFLKGRNDAYCYTSKEELNFALSSAILNDELSYEDIVLIKGSNGMKMWEQYEFIRKLLERGSSVSAQTRLLIDVDALKHNYSVIKNYVGNNVQVMPVIKADAYGTGANLLANIYNDCDFFAVADLIEAEELHNIMPQAKFLVLYQSLPEETEWIAERSDYVVASVGDINYVKILNESAIKKNKKLTVHIEVDTGMSRLGVVLNDCEQLAKEILKCENLIVDGIFTHYSSADMYSPADLEYTELQTEKFNKAIAIIESILGKIHYKHACAGAAIFNPKSELFNMVRPGYILHGYYPCKEIKDKVVLKPALKYVTQVTQVKEYDVGESISYGRNYVTNRKTRLAEIPVGYSDGLMRKLSNVGAFVIKGQLAPIVGNVTMDYTMVDVTDIKPIVWAGDDVAIFDNVNMTIEKMAELCETIGYEIIANIKNKADHIEIF